MGFRQAFAEHPLRTALVFEGATIPLSLALALLLGVTPWADLAFSAVALALSGGATVVLGALLMLLALIRPGWFQEAEAQVRPLIEMLFRGRGPGPIIALCALAGIGEELLFRGVLQVWLAGPIGAWPAVVLAAIVFGLLHYLSHTYFALAVGLGIYLGALYQLSGNLVVPILVHALYDGIAVAYMLRHSDDPGPHEVQ